MQVRHPLRSGIAPTFALALGLGACDGGTDAPVPSTLTLSPTEATIETIGATRQITAVVKEAGGQVIEDPDVTWTSSSSGVATVDGEGLVTAVSTGTTTITARAGAATDEAMITVAMAAFACLPGDGTAVGLSVGESMILTDPTEFCLTLPAATGREYLVGVQSIRQSGGGNATTPVLVQSSTDPAGPQASAADATAGAAPGPSVASAAASLARLDDPATRRRRAWRAQHTRRLERDLDYLRTLASAGALRAAGSAGAQGPQPAVVRPGMELGDSVRLRVRQADAQCGLGDFENVTAELVWKGERAWWFNDTDNPEAFTLEDWQALGDRFDDTTDPVAREYFGAPNDLDGNGVIVVLFTRALNERGEDDEGITTLGFVNPCDFLPRNTFETSNEGEFFYHIAADPQGVAGDTVPTDVLIPQASFVIAHEYTHIIQFSRRFESGAPLMDIFMAEGQATLAEEVVGHRVLGNRPGQNYGVQTAFDDEGFDWYANGFVDLFFYYGADLEEEERIFAAPEECTWTSVDPPDPCKGRALWYGVTWSLLRWANDQFGERFGGGEAELQRSLVDSDLTGFENLASVTGESISFLLGHWAPMLYMDDRIDGLDPRLRMTSWNLFSIYTGLNPDLVDILRPLPRPRSTTDWEDEFDVRSPSFEWYTITTNGQAAGVRATTQARQVLPSHMQLFVVRIR